MTIRPAPLALARAMTGTIACALAVTVAPLSASTIVGYDSSTLRGPVWDRPNFAGTGLASLGAGATFHAQSFSVAVDGTYSVRSVHNNSIEGDRSRNWDGATFLYEGSFSPTRPLDNLLMGDYLARESGTTGFDDVPLTAGQTYHLITSGVRSSDAGIFTTSIFGPGDIFLTQRNFAYDATTIGGGRWHKPLPGGNGFYPGAPAAIHHVQEFSVSETDLYDFLGFANRRDSQWGLGVFLYEQAFNPASPLTNLVSGEVDWPDFGIASFNRVPLEQGVPYFLVTSGRDNREAGPFTNIVTGPGTVTFGPTPDPLPPFKPEPELPPGLQPGGGTPGPAVIPLPASLPLLLAALAALGLLARRDR